MYQKRSPMLSYILYLDNVRKNGKKIIPLEIHKRLKSICEYKNKIPPDVTKEHIVILFVALAKFGYTWKQIEKISGFENLLLKTIIKNAIKFDSQEIAEMLWALAKLGFTLDQTKGPLRKDLRNTILFTTYMKLKEFKPKEISITLWALVKLGCTWKQIIEINGFNDLLLKTIMKNIVEYNQHGVLNTLCGLAKLGCTWKQIEEINGLEDLLLKTIMKNIVKYNQRDVLNTLCGLATLGFTLGQINKPQNHKIILQKARNRIYKHLDIKDKLTIDNASKSLDLLKGNNFYKNRQQPPKSKMLGSILDLYRLAENIKKNPYPEICALLNNICNYKNEIPRDVTTKNIVMLFSALAKLELTWKLDLNVYQTALLTILSQCENKYALDSKETASTLWNLAKLGCTWKQIKQIKTPKNLGIIIQKTIKDNLEYFDSTEKYTIQRASKKLGLPYNNLWKNQQQPPKRKMLGSILDLYRLAGNIEESYYPKIYALLNYICIYKIKIPSNVTKKNILMLFVALAKLGLTWKNDLSLHQTDLLKILSQCENESALDSKETASTLWALAMLGCPCEKIKQIKTPKNLRIIIQKAINKHYKKLKAQDKYNKHNKYTERTIKWIKEFNSLDNNFFKTKYQTETFKILPRKRP